jgi:hypothetical protein
MMSRKVFLTIVSVIALAVGSLALFAPAALLESKGVAPSEAGNVWARELGVALIAIGVCAVLVRRHDDSPTMRAFLIGNAILQFGLFPIEIAAYSSGVITKASGIIPNSILHVVLAAAFVHFAVRVKVSNNAETRARYAEHGSAE